MRHAQRAAGVLLVTALGVSLAGCGGDDQPDTKGPTSPAPTSASPTPTESSTPTASPSPTQPPLSKFESRPPVQAARAWARAIAQDINARDRDYAHTRPVSTAAGKARLDSYARRDIASNFRYPGPLPFTPVSVKQSGGATRVTSCAWTQGWGQKRKTGKPGNKKQIVGATFVMKQVGRRWKLDAFLGARTDCSDVTVKGLAFS